MRKVINSKLETVSIPSIRNEGAYECPERDEVLMHHSTARVQAFGSVKRIVRDKTDRNPASLVKYVFLSGDCYTQQEAWQQALEHIFP